MQYITLQSDAEPTNHWVKDYINIGESWEAVVMELEGKISGLVTPYGIDIEAYINIDKSRKLYLSVKKHLENTKGGGFDLKPRPFSEIVEVKVNLYEKSDRPRMLLIKNNLLNKILTKFKGFKKNIILDNHILYSDNQELPYLKELKKLTLLPKFGKMSIYSSSIIFKLYSLPENKEGNNRLIEIIKEINKRIS